MFYMRYFIIFFQVYLQDGSLHILFIVYINFVFVFVSGREERHLCQPSPPKVRAEAPCRTNQLQNATCIATAGLWLRKSVVSA